MSTLSLGSTSIVTSNAGNFNYGGFAWLGVVPESEIYQKSIPGSSGIYEVKSGDRSRIISVRCTWHTDDDEALENLLLQLHASTRYQTLKATSGALRSDKMLPYCRLSGIGLGGEPVSGYLGSADAFVMTRVLTFTQRRVAY